MVVEKLIIYKVILLLCSA